MEKSIDRIQYGPYQLVYDTEAKESGERYISNVHLPGRLDVTWKKLQKMAKRNGFKLEAPKVLK